MYSSTEDETVISEELWRVWGHKEKRREQAMARKRKVVSGIILSLLALGCAVYFIVVR
jgi:hypothetical protein